MDDWQQMRIVAATEFSGRLLSVRIANLLRGTSPYLFIQIVPNGREADVDDLPYADWDSKRRIPLPVKWSRPDLDPWALCKYYGPASPVDIDAIYEGVTAHNPAAAQQLAKLIDAHLDGSVLAETNRARLRKFLKADFALLSCQGLVHGADRWRAAGLTLASAQDIHAAVAARQPLTVRQIRQAEVLLKYAPIEFGYWGRFKALVKSAPASELGDAYAEAIARLSGPGSQRPLPRSVSIENLEVIKGWFDVPGYRTRKYLARRARRDLAALADRAPDKYAQVAARLLVSWDQPLSNDAFAPAYIMLGAKKALDSRSRHVQRQPDMSARRDAHPEIWNERPELVGEIFASVRASVEALTWSFQVLEELGNPPSIVSGQIPLALDSSYQPLVRLGCAAVAEHSELFSTLTAQQWAVFFRRATNAEVDEAFEALTLQHQLRAVGEALAMVLAEPAEKSDRQAKLALLYLAAPKPPFIHPAAADSLAVLAAVERYQLKYRSTWGPYAERMSAASLVAIYRSLAERDASDLSLEAVADAVLGKNWVAPELMLECLGSDDPEVVKLGRRLILARGGPTFVFSNLLPGAIAGRVLPSTALRVASRLLPEATKPEDVVDILRWSSASRIPDDQLASLVVESPLGPSALWGAMAVDGFSKADDLAGSSAETTRRIGDAVVPEQLLSGSPAQLRFTLRYITENEERIANDSAFGVAAVMRGEISLQVEALRQLEAAGHLPQVWRELADSGSQSALAAVRKYLMSLPDPVSASDAVVTCLESPTRSVWEMGVKVFQARPDLAEDRPIWTALARSDDPQLHDMVSAARSLPGRVDDSVLVEFDGRTVLDPNSRRKAKEYAKRRLEVAVPHRATATADYVEMLLNLARGPIRRDREWALMRLASLRLQGVDIGGLEVSLTSEGAVGLKDLAP